MSQPTECSTRLRVEGMNNLWWQIANTFPRPGALPQRGLVATTSRLFSDVAKDRHAWTDE